MSLSGFDNDKFRRLSKQTRNQGSSKFPKFISARDNTMATSSSYSGYDSEDDCSASSDGTVGDTSFNGKDEVDVYQAPSGSPPRRDRGYMDDVPAKGWLSWLWKTDGKSRDAFCEAMREADGDAKVAESRYASAKRIYQLDKGKAGMDGSEKWMNRWWCALALNACGWVVMYLYPIAIFAKCVDLITAIVALSGFYFFVEKSALTMSSFRRQVVDRAQYAVDVTKASVARVVAYGYLTSDWSKVIVCGSCATLFSLMVYKNHKRMVARRKMEYSYMTYEGTISALTFNRKKYMVSDLAYMVESVVALIALILGSITGFTDACYVYNVISKGVNFIKTGACGLFVVAGLFSQDQVVDLPELDEIESALKKRENVEEKAKSLKDKVPVAGYVVEDVIRDLKNHSLKTKLMVLSGIVTVLFVLIVTVYRKTRRMVYEAAVGKIVNLYYDVNIQKWRIWFQGDQCFLSDDLTEKEFSCDGFVVITGEYLETLPRWVKMKIIHVVGNPKNHVRIPEMKKEAKKLLVIRSKRDGNKRGWMAYDENSHIMNIQDDDVLVFRTHEDYEDWFDSVYRTSKNNVYINDDLSYGVDDAPKYGKAGKAVGETKVSSSSSNQKKYKQPKCQIKGCNKKCGNWHFLPPCVDGKCDGECGKYHKKHKNFVPKMKPIAESMGGIIPQEPSMHINRHVSVAVLFDDGSVQRCFAFMLSGCLWTVGHIFFPMNFGNAKVKSLSVVSDGKVFTTSEKIWYTHDTLDCAVIRYTTAMKQEIGNLQSLKRGLMEADGAAVDLWMDGGLSCHGTARFDRVRKVVVHSCPTKEGYCGGSLLNSSGKVIAIHNMGDGSTSGIPQNEAVHLSDDLHQQMLSAVSSKVDFRSARASL